MQNEQGNGEKHNYTKLDMLLLKDIFICTFS